MSNSPKVLIVPKGSSYSKIFNVNIEKNYTMMLFEEGNPLSNILIDMMNELDRADKKYNHDPMKHMKVGLKTIHAEFIELEREVERFDYNEGNPEWLRKEAIQVTAMGVKFLRDICNKLREGENVKND